MSKSLTEYLDWLDGRSDLIWPKAPAVRPLKATPACKPLPGLRAVLWDVYGTLLTIHDGRLVHRHPQPLRIQVALEKTIQEFNMWYSMTRKPGQPWEYMLQQYEKLLEDAAMVGTPIKGDTPEIDSARIWGKLLDRLRRNEYSYDVAFYGDYDELAQKVAYFFHASQQGVAAAPGAVSALQAVLHLGRKQGLLGDGQCFTPAQLQRALQRQQPTDPLQRLLSPGWLFLSTQFGLKLPSPSLLAQVERNLKAAGFASSQVLVVSCRLDDYLGPAKRFGFRTALYAGDANACRVEPEDLRDPEMKPDRLLTDLTQIEELLAAD